MPPQPNKDFILGGSSQQGRTKTMASRSKKKGKDVQEPPEQEVLPSENTKEMPLHKWY